MAMWALDKIPPLKKNLTQAAMGFKPPTTGLARGVPLGSIARLKNSN